MSDSVSTPSAAPASPTPASSPAPSGGNSSNPSPSAAATPPAQQATPTQAQKERLKYTIDGQDVEEEVDFSDKEAIRKKLQLAYAAEKRLGEAKTVKTRANELIHALENNPSEFLAKLGPKGKEAAEAFLLEHIKKEMMTPEQRKIMELEQFKAQTEAERKKAADLEAKKKQDDITKHHAEKFQTTIIDALAKSGLPKTPGLVREVARHMKTALERGIELTPDDLVDLVKKDTVSKIKSLIGDSDGQQLLALFGDDVANKIRKHDIKALQDRHSKLTTTSTSEGGGPAAPRESGPVSIEQWREDLDKRYAKK